MSKDQPTIKCTCGKTYPIPTSPVRENQRAICTCGKKVALFLTMGTTLPSNWRGVEKVKIPVSPAKEKFEEDIKKEIDEKDITGEMDLAYSNRKEPSMDEEYEIPEIKKSLIRKGNKK